MFKIKFALIVILLALALTIGQPEMIYSSTAGINEMPPAVTLVRDRESSMLAGHDFGFDNDMLIPVSPSSDDGFYVKIQQ